MELYNIPNDPYELASQHANQANAAILDEMDALLEGTITRGH